MSLPDWLEPLYDAETCAASTAGRSTSCGIPSLDLMERAAQGLAAWSQRVAPAGLVVVCCGAGNNGGDGYVAARLLRGRGARGAGAAVTDPRELTGDARAEARAAAGAPAEAVQADGTGGRRRRSSTRCSARARRGRRADPSAGALAAIARRRRPGRRRRRAERGRRLDRRGGRRRRPRGRHRDVPRAKPGLWIAPGKRHAGEVTVIDIGIPRGRAGAAATIGLIRDGRCWPRCRGATAGDTKFTSGRRARRRRLAGPHGRAVRSRRRPRRGRGPGTSRPACPASRSRCSTARLWRS